MIKLFRDTDIGGSLSGGPYPIPEDVRKKIEEYARDKQPFFISLNVKESVEFGYSLSLPTIQAQEERIRVLEEALEYESRNWHIVFYRATSQLTAREIEELWIERLPKFRKRYNLAAPTP